MAGRCSSTSSVALCCTTSTLRSACAASSLLRTAGAEHPAHRPLFSTTTLTTTPVPVLYPSPPTTPPPHPHPTPSRIPLLYPTEADLASWDARRTRYFAVTHGRQVQLWRTPTLEVDFAPFVLHRTYAGHDDEVLSIEWAADSSYVAAGGAAPRKERTCTD